MSILFFCSFYTGCIVPQNNIGLDIIIVGFDEPAQFDTIQDAIDECSSHKTIKVLPGLYEENIVINKSISLISDHKERTIIDGKNYSDVIKIAGENVTIDGFTIQHSGRNYHFSDYDAGIEIESNYIQVRNCSFQNNTGGIEIRSDHNQVIDCYFHHNTFGIYLILAENNNVSSNIFTSNAKEGIWIYSGIGNIINNENRFISNEIGAKLKNTKLNVIQKNLFQHNQQGLYFCCGSMNNTVAFNSFINNSKRHIFDMVSMNKYYNQQESVGNFWDDYNGVDKNNDGIGDVVYNISNDPKKQDKYPLMNSWISR